MVEKNRLMLMVGSVSKCSAGVLAELASKTVVPVLHVDDDLCCLKVAKHCLEMQGNFRVDTALSVDEAGEKMEKETYAAIVSDYEMPGKNGLEFLKELRDEGNDIPFIIFTGRGKEELAIEALNLGADGYFDKHGDAETVYCQLAHGILLVVEKWKAKMKAFSEEERLRAVLSSSPDAIMVSDLNGNIVDCNEAALNLTGISSKESILGRNSLEFVSEKDRKRALENVKETIEKGITKNVVYSLLKIDGKEYQGEVSASILKGSHGKPAGFVAVVRDITQRIMAEDVLKKSEEKFRVLLENLPQRIFFKDRNSAYISCNGNYAQDLGIGRDQIAGKTDYDFYPKRLAEKYRADDKRIMDSKYTEDIEEEYVQNGQNVYVHTVKTPVKDENGKVIGILGIFWDRKERKKTEEIARAREERYRSYIDLTGQLGWVTNAYGEVDEDIPAWRKFTGQNHEEVKGRGWTKALHPDDLERVMRTWEKAVETKGAYEVEYRIRRHDGIYRHFLARGVPVRKKDGSIGEWVGTCIDITDRRQWEEALRDAKEKWVSLTENTDDIVMIVDNNGVIRYVNRTMPPYTPEETVGKTVYEYVSAEQQSIIEKSFKEVIRTGKSDNYQISSNIPKTGTVWFNTKIVPIKHDRKATAAILISANITDQRRAEEELHRAIKKLDVMNEKLRVVGSLARHDVRNKLVGVTGNAYLLRQRFAGDPKVLERLKDIEAAVLQVERIFEFARTYERLGVEQLSYMDIGKTIDEAVSLFSDLKGVKIVNECPELAVLSDSLLRQLFYNLVDNSLKYGEKIRQITFHCEMTRADELELVYEDDGVGISNSVRGNLFKEGAGKSTGYGLFMIKRICEVYGWNIQEADIQGKGVKFVITIPKANPNGIENYQIAQSD
jgi:PAS domain S-box-containing protein